MISYIQDYNNIGSEYRIPYFHRCAICPAKLQMQDFMLFCPIFRYGGCYEFDKSRKV